MKEMETKKKRPGEGKPGTGTICYKDFIKSAEFLVSNTTVKNCPQGDFVEFAFIGRSNVGKSSLINMVLGRKGLAKTSSTPGKTMLINHYKINDSWYLVDLPGYGYASRGMKEKENIQRMIEEYIINRGVLYHLFVLVDSRLKPQRIDLEFMYWLEEHEIPYGVVFTKVDKLKGDKRNANIEAYMRELNMEYEIAPPHFVTSAVTKQGRDSILDYMNFQIVEVFEGNHGIYSFDNPLNLKNDPDDPDDDFDELDDDFDELDDDFDDLEEDDDHF